MVSADRSRRICGTTPTTSGWSRRPHKGGSGFRRHRGRYLDNDPFIHLGTLFPPSLDSVWVEITLDPKYDKGKSFN